MATHVATMNAISITLQMAFLGTAEISDADLTACADTIERADSVGPIVHPSEYKRALSTGTLDQQRQLIAWMRQTKALAQGLFPQLANVQADQPAEGG